MSEKIRVSGKFVEFIKRYTLEHEELDEHAVVELDVTEEDIREAIMNGWRNIKAISINESTSLIIKLLTGSTPMVEKEWVEKIAFHCNTDNCEYFETKNGCKYNPAIGASCNFKSKEEKRSCENLYEKLAEIEHQRWADWQRYCHKILREKCPSPELEKAIERWERQIYTPYRDLSEKEKQSDRDQVDRYWHLIEPKTKEEKRSCEKERTNFDIFMDISELDEKAKKFLEKTCRECRYRKHFEEPKQPPKEIDWAELECEIKRDNHRNCSNGLMRLVDIVRSLYEKVEGVEK